MQICNFLLLTALFPICLFTAALAQEPMPDTLQVAGQKYDVVIDKRDVWAIDPTHPLPHDFRFDKDRADPRAGLAKDLQKQLSEQVFLRAPRGGYALPWRGEAAQIGYVDVAKKAHLSWEQVFPALEKHNYYRWVAFCRDASEMPGGYFLFVSRWDRETKKNVSWRATVSFAEPSRPHVESMNGNGVRGLFTRRGDQLPAVIYNGHRAVWAILSARTGKVMIKSKITDNPGGVLHAAISPDGKRVFVTGGRGVTVFGLDDAKPLKHIDRVGNPRNARTLGVTFAPGGKVACVSTPYAYRLTLIDTDTLEVLADYKTKQPLAGIEFDKSRGQASARVTFLPYE